MKTLFLVLAFLVVSCKSQKRPKFVDNSNLSVTQVVVHKNTKNRELNQKYAIKVQKQKSKELGNLNNKSPNNNKSHNNRQTTFKFY